MVVGSQKRLMMLSPFWRSATEARSSDYSRRQVLGFVLLGTVGRLVLCSSQALTHLLDLVCSVRIDWPAAAEEFVWPPCRLAADPPHTRWAENFVVAAVVVVKKE